MRVNVDSDNVVVDFISQYVKQLKRDGGRRVTDQPEHYECYRDWNMTRDEFIQFMRDHAFVIFANAPEVPDAIAGVKRLVAAGHDVRIVTHKVWPIDPELTFRAQRATVQWYQVHGLLPLVDLVFTAGSKQSYPADVVVDDKPTLEWAQADALNLLFDRSWNQDVDHPDVARVDGWHELARTVGA